MAKTANINLRIEPTLKKEAEELFGSFDISVTDAINIFLNTAIMQGGFPFQIRQPRYNKPTELAIEEAQRIIAGDLASQSYSTFSDFLNDLNEE